jgi:hypothetical protein
VQYFRFKEFASALRDNFLHGTRTGKSPLSIVRNFRVIRIPPHPPQTIPLTEGLLYLLRDLFTNSALFSANLIQPVHSQHTMSILNYVKQHISKHPTFKISEISFVWSSHSFYTGRDISVGIAARYGLDDPGIGSRFYLQIFRTCPDRPWGPPSLLYNGHRSVLGGELHLTFTYYFTCVLHVAPIWSPMIYPLW